MMIQQRSVVLGLQMCGEEQNKLETGHLTSDSASPCQNITLTPSLKNPHGVCAHLIHTGAPWTLKPLRRKKSPLEQEHQGLMGSTTKVGAGWDRPQRHCCLGGATSPLYQLLKIEFGSFGQVPPNSFKRCPCSSAQALFWQPLPKVAYRLFFTSFPRLRNRKQPLF